MHGEILRFDDAGGAVALAAERNIVGIEQHAVIPPLRRADAVIRALYLCKIANGDDLIALVIHPAKGDHGVCTVITGNPGEALPAEINLPQRGMLEVEMVERLHIVPQLCMFFIIEQKPVQLGGKIPLLKLPEFLPHEK